MEADPAPLDPGSAGVIRQLVATALEWHPDDPLLPDLLPRYYAEIPEADVEDGDSERLLTRAVEHLDAGRRRARGVTVARIVHVPGSARPTDARSVLYVVTDDAPFLVDTVRMVLDTHELGIHLLVHPMLPVRRDDQGAVEALGDGPIEAWTQVEIDRCPDDLVEVVEREVVAATDEVHLSVRDFPAMRDRLATFRSLDPLVGWLADEHLVFLGAASYDTDAGGELVLRSDSCLGILRADHSIDPPHPPAGSPLTAERFWLARAERVSHVHRAARLVCVTALDEHGGVHRFVGLLASGAYRQSVMAIPTIGDRARAVLGLFEGSELSHTARSMRNVLETLPRDVVFELDADRLGQLVIDIVGLQERSIVRLFDVPEPVGPFTTVLAFLPRSRFEAGLPDRVAAIVGEAYGSEVRDVESLVGTSSLARITMTVKIGDTGRRPDLEHVADLVETATRTWHDRALDALVEQYGDERGRDLCERIGSIAPASFRATIVPERAVTHLDCIDRALTTASGIATALVHDPDAPHDEWRFCVARRDEPLSLADLLPILGHIGLQALDEHPDQFRIDDRVVQLYDVRVQLLGGAQLDPMRVDEMRLAFEGLLAGTVEADDLNRLVALAGIGVGQVAVLRLYVRYLRQIGFGFSQAYVEEVLARNAAATIALVDLFEARLEPGVRDRDATVETARAELAACLDEVEALDDDRILRKLAELIAATTRTNAYRSPSTLAVKLDPSAIADLPEPRPQFEIFVCSPEVEGVHLRGGPIARGGLRWSDRREDFRTEVLGLVKAQMVKNAVIVPVGAKGGFVVKRPPADPADLRGHVEVCYRAFVSSMLSLTDDVRGSDVVHPERTVVHDGPDPYLVVAADKGTASFSDLANSVAEEHGFWLGDAFASGGSAGYDHKAMGITARGAWESVRRHARTLGLDADHDGLTVVGIGDMSGDVFGNGLLQSPHVRLVAAFDHRHVFLDPDPDPAVSFAERRRLFDLPRSSWADYDPSLISPGGGVHPRTVKSIELSTRARVVLGTEATTVSPIELIRIILRAPVDLLWNGGIGTYVKASTEHHVDVGDRANDAVRVDGAELRCRMVGEGGNLGFTQLGRIEYDLAGGLINTDAIDNSAGVDCSDHEVNIKILLGGAVADDELTRDARDQLLAEMTDEVAELVLDNNRAQTLALMIARRQALPLVNVHARYLDLLVAERWLDRQLEFLPTDKQLAERQASGSGLRSPELSVLLAYTKNADVAELLQTDVPDDEWFVDDLIAYFPTPLRSRFRDRILGHRLRREIVATRLVNQMVNLSGISYDHRMTEDTGASVGEIVRSWVVVRDVVDFADLWHEIDALGTSVPLQVQLDLFLDLRRAAERCSLWVLRHRRPPIDIAGSVAELREPVAWIADHLHDVVRGTMAAAVDSTEIGFVAAGVPPALARQASVWPLLHTTFDVAEVARREQATLAAVAATYWEVFDRLDLLWLWEGISGLPRNDRWQNQARSAVRDDLLGALAGLCTTVTRETDGSVTDWLDRNARGVERTQALLTELRRAERLDLTTLSVALRQLRNLGGVTAAAGAS